MRDNKLKPNEQNQDADILSQLVLDSLTAEVAVLNRNGFIVAVNDAWRRFARENGGTPEATGVGANYLEICRRADGDELSAGKMVSQGIENVLNGTRDVFKFEYPCHSGTHLRWFLLHVSRLNTAIPHVVTTHLPITERKLTEQRLVVAERLAAIGEAMQGLSHVGRNALQKAQAHIALLRIHLEENPEALELVQKIETSQEKLLGLYEEVKSYAGPIILNRQPYSLQSLVEKVWASITSPVETASFSLRPSTKDSNCEIDVDAMARVLRELFKNALTAVGEAPKVQVSVGDDYLEGLPAATLIVSDNGCGVPVEDWEKVFQPFYSTKTHGTGLGLAVSKRIVAAHDGRIQFGPSKLEGASVYITLPKLGASTE